MANFDTTGLKQALNDSESQGSPASLFVLLPETVIWRAAHLLLNDPEQREVYGPLLLNSIHAALPDLDQQQAANIILQALTLPTGGLTFHTAVNIVLSHAILWDRETVKQFLSACTHAYDALKDGDDIFIASVALDGLIQLPLYRDDARQHLRVVLQLIDEFPPIPADPDAPAFLPVKALKLLGQSYDYQPSQHITDHVEQMVKTHHRAVVTEAQFTLGVIRLYDAFRAQDAPTCAVALREAESLFLAASDIEENRSDALLFGLITRCFAAMLTSPMPPDIAQHVQEARDVLRERMHAFGGATESRRVAEMEYAGVSLIDALDRWVAQVMTAHQSPNIMVPMQELAQVFATVRTLEEPPGLVGAASQTGRTHIMLPLIRGRFVHIQAIQAKLEAILSDAALSDRLSPVEHDLYTLVLRELQEAPSPKDDAATRLAPLRAAADRYDPVFAQQIDSLLAQDRAYDEILLDMASWRLNQHAQEALAIGSLGSSAHMIYQEITGEVRKRLQWDEQYIVWQYFNDLLKLIAQYIVVLLQVSTKEDPNTNFLLAKKEGGLGEDAHEAHLQNHFYNHMRFIELFLAPQWKGKVNLESITDTPGRADIFVQFPGSVAFVIEVKCEAKDSSRDALHRRYLAQAQAYAAGTQSVSFLFVLDTTRKDPALPLRDAKDYCYVDQITLADTYHPTAVVVCLFPANRYLPHTLSKSAKSPTRSSGNPSASRGPARTSKKS